MAKVKSQKLEGIGGWLIVFLVIFFIDLFSVAFGSLGSAFLNQGLLTLPTLLFSVVLLICMVGSLICIFKKLKITKKVVIVTLILLIGQAVGSVVYSLSTEFGASVKGLAVFISGLDILTYVLFILYFLFSVRVKNTFVK